MSQQTSHTVPPSATPAERPGDLTSWSAQLEGQSAEDILRWAAGQYAPKLTCASSLGLEDVVMLDLIARLQLPIDVFTLDTGLLFLETYDLKRRLEDRYGVAIRNVVPEFTVAEQAQREGNELWLREPDRCCEMRKVLPLRATLANFDAWITAIRRDQTPERANAPVVGWDGRFGLIKVNPLVRWTFGDVQAYVKKYDVPYNPLHDQSYPSIGCTPCTSPVRLGEDPRSGRWRGKEKTECGLHLKAPSTSA
jgi:phosphoadenosine phosphosulfate reductase